MISGNRIYLRPVLPTDAPVILRWENDPEYWPVTATPGPFTIDQIRSFIRSSSDLYSDGQLRLMICLLDGHLPIGAVDLFHFDKRRRSAGVGILIGEKDWRKQGFATDALSALVRFAADDLRLHSLECLIYPDNEPSTHLFRQRDFRPAGVEFFNDKRAVRYVLELAV